MNSSGDIQAFIVKGPPKFQSGGANKSSSAIPSKGENFSSSQRTKFFFPLSRSAEASAKQTRSLESSKGTWRTLTSKRFLKSLMQSGGGTVMIGAGLHT